MIDLLRTWFLAALAVFFPDILEPTTVVYNGYIEANFVYVSAESPGRIKRLWVSEGSEVMEGQPVVLFDDAAARATLSAAEARVRIAEADLANLETGSREQEIAVIRAELAKAEAERELAASNLERSQRLLAGGTIAETRVDIDMVALRTAEAQVAERRAQLDVAELPARDAQRAAAEAALEAARADAELARSAVRDRIVLAPASGTVDKLFFDVGEVASTGVPVMSIIDFTRLKAVFFIPESDIATISDVDRFAVTCDSCGDVIKADLLRVDAAPQFTPPIIYSRDERQRLVFRAEARIEGGRSLRPGQPVTLEPLP